MFNGHMDTSYSGREPWLRGVSGFQPEAFVRDGRLYGLGISNMKGALACYVEAVRALADAGIRLRGDVLIAAVCGEIEKTQQGDAVGPSTGDTPPARATSSRTAASPTCACSASPPRARSCSATSARSGSAFESMATSSTRPSARGSAAENAILRLHQVLAAVQEWIPTWEDDPSNGVPRRQGDRQRRRRRGRLRLARLADAAPRRPVPRRPRPADEADGRRAARGARHGARARGAFPATSESRARST